MKYKGKEYEDCAIITKYQELGNVWKVGELFGISGQSIHVFLKKKGVIHQKNYFTKSDEDVLLEKYNLYANAQKLDVLAKELGRTVPFISRKAKELGLTNGKRTYELDDETHKKKSLSAKKRIEKHGHPRGMLGKKHTQEYKKDQSERIKKLWQEERERFTSPERLVRMSDLMSEMQASGALGVRSRCYITNATINDKTFTFKSNWELNVALYLEYKRVLNEIKDWDYETIKFEFKYNGSGVRTYRPDFRIKYNNGDCQCVELKGWEDLKTKKKRELMAEFYPKIKIDFWEASTYRNIEREYKDKISLWDYRLGNKAKNIDIKVVAEKFVDKENPRVEFRVVAIE